MERAIRASGVVDSEGRVELSAPDLTPGMEIEAILIVREPESAERERLVRAILEGEEDIAAGRTRPAGDFFAEYAERYAVSG